MTEAVASTPTPPGGAMSLAIDIHTHYVPHGWPDLATSDETAAEGEWPWLGIDTERDATIMLGTNDAKDPGDGGPNRARDRSPTLHRAGS